MDLIPRITDPRIPQAIMLVESMVMRRDYVHCKCTIFEDNILMVSLYNTVLYRTHLTDVQQGSMLSFMYNDYNKENHTVIPNRRIGEQMIPLRVKYDSDSTRPLLYLEHIQNLEWFAKYRSIKIADGCKFLKFVDNNGNMYYAPIFSSFPSIGSKDKLSIGIYSDIPGYYIMKYILFKYKINREVVMEFRCLNINESLETAMNRDREFID